MPIRSARFTFAVAFAVAAPAFAQNLELPRPSPNAKVSQMVGITEVAVEYSSPGVKGRPIWGKLVPFAELWRTGANAATKISFSREAKVGDKTVAPGSYSLFTIPGPESWIVILNKNPTASTREYKQELDAARIPVRPTSLAQARERMTFLFAGTTDRGTSLDLEWDKLRVSLPIQVATDEQVAAQLKSLGDQGWRPWNSAARYLLEEKKDFDGALALVDKSLGLKEDWFNVWTKAQVLAAKGQTQQAYALAEKANALGQKAEYFFFADEVKKALGEWKGKAAK